MIGESHQKMYTLMTLVDNIPTSNNKSHFGLRNGIFFRISHFLTIHLCHNAPMLQCHPSHLVTPSPRHQITNAPTLQCHSCHLVTPSPRHQITNAPTLQCHSCHLVTSSPRHPVIKSPMPQLYIANSLIS
jgi:hypothetical protein